MAACEVVRLAMACMLITLKTQRTSLGLTSSTGCAEEGAKQQAGPAGTEAAQEPAALEPLEQPATLAQAAAAGIEEDDDEDDSKETCGFCKFMKGGGCRKEFIVSGALGLLGAGTSRDSERPQLLGLANYRSWR